MEIPASELKICMPFTIKALHVTTGNPQKLKLELLKKGCYCLHHTSVTQCYCLIKRATVPARLGPSHCREMSPQKDLRINVPVLKWTHSRSSLQASSTQVFLFPLLYNAQFLHTDRLLKHTRLYSEYSLFMDHGLRTVKWLDYFVVYMAHALGNGIN